MHSRIAIDWSIPIKLERMAYAHTFGYAHTQWTRPHWLLERMAYAWHSSAMGTVHIRSVICGLVDHGIEAL